jgi:hypothetical protein
MTAVHRLVVIMPVVANNHRLVPTNRLKLLVMKRQGALIAMLLTASLLSVAQNTKKANEAVSSANNTPRCAGNPTVVGECLLVHGRLSVWNGNPTFRIWPVGTKRMLGVREEFEAPTELDPYLGHFDDVVYADFNVCPLTKPRPGVMQIVCVESATHIEKTTGQHSDRLSH